MELSHSSFPRPTDLLDWPRDRFTFEGTTVELHGFEWAAHPFSGFVDPGASAHTGFLADFFATVSRGATDALRPKYGRLYGFEEATLPNAEMVAWATYEYR
ncbi:hypothetical protein [Streptomyces prasinus]|uniref:hypothetical protein n=1 Tax=Streptomyces prasinus TaxID=67345 RepID=UPI0036A9F580